eukprot:g6007.t1
MIAHPAINAGGKVSQGPAWGLQEQLGRLGKTQGGGCAAGEEEQDRGVCSKIRVSVTGPALAHKIEEHFAGEKASHREILGLCAQEVDKALSVLVQRVKKKLLGTIDKMDRQLLSLEGDMRQLCRATEEKGNRMIRQAKQTADSEREEKAILCQWLNGFLVGASSEPQLSSMDFTFARFALNMAMASSRTDPEVMLKAGAPAFLVGMLSNPNELVTGPAVLALSQMAHHEACQRALGLAGGVPPLVLLCFTSKSPAVLAQACISLAQLSRYPSNRAIIAGKGGIAAMVRLLEGFRIEEHVTLQVIEQALSALVNVMFRSDANRGLAEECGATLPTITIMDAADDEGVLVQACLTLANMAYGNQFAALRLLEAGADKAACDLIRDSDKTRHSNVAEAAFICLANLANNALNQAHVGAGGSVDLALTVCKHCQSPRVVRAAAQALCSLTLKNQANKTRCASLDAVATLLDVAAVWGVAEDGGSRSQSRSAPSSTAAAVEEEEAAAAAQAACCMAILMQHPTNAHTMKRTGGLRQLAELISDSEDSEVIIATAKAIVVLLPDADELLRTSRNGKVSQAEEAGAHEALVRCREWAYGRKAPPSWLVYGLDLLGSEIEALEARMKQEGASSLRKPEEFFVATDFFEEREIVIPPDVTVAEDEDLGGMLFHALGHIMQNYPPSRALLNGPEYRAWDDPLIEYCPHCYNARGPKYVKQRAVDNVDPAVLDAYGGPNEFPLYNSEFADNGNYLEPDEIAVRHGFCGDPEQNAAEGSNRYSTANINWEPASSFISGQVLEMDIVMNAYHWGHCEFFVCNTDEMDDSDGVPTQECFNKHPLTRAEDDGGASPIDPKYPGRYYVDPECREGETEQGPKPIEGYNIRMRYVLPDIECEHCILQMVYYTGNTCKHIGYEEFNPPSWNSACAPNKSDWIELDRYVCGTEGQYPEEFWSCSDFSMSSDGSAPAPPAYPADEDEDDIAVEVYEYVGCYSDTREDRVLFDKLDSPDMTTELCLEHCSGAAFMATQYSYECFCSTDEDLEYDRYGDGAVCDMNCLGDESETCGGHYAFSLYRIL